MSSLVDERERGRVPELRAGSRVGAYELLAPIASGGMGRVWAARPIDIKNAPKLVAIKTMHAHQANSDEFRRIYLNEGEIGSRIHHPNVCEVREIGEERGIVYLVLEWLMGESLDQVLRPKGAAEPIDLRRAVGIVAEAARGLHAAHLARDDQGEHLHVVHRDVSPQNIMVTTDGAVKIIDFGVARARNQYSDRKRGEIRGKISYIAPEQLAGKSFDRRADVYSLAVVLYEITTGRPPFNGETDVVLYQQVLRGEMLPPSRIIEDFPGALEKIIVRGLSEDPAFRVKSASEFAKLLDAWLAANGGPLKREEVAGLLHERVEDRLAKRKQKILDGSNTLSGYAPPRPPRSVTPSSVSVSGVLERESLGKVPAERASAFSLPPYMHSGRYSAPSLDGLPEAPKKPTPVQYILASAVGIGVVLILAIVVLLFRSAH